MYSTNDLTVGCNKCWCNLLPSGEVYTEIAPHVWFPLSHR